MKKLCNIVALLLLALIFLVPNFGQCNAPGFKQVTTKFGSIDLPKRAYIVEYDYSEALNKAENLSETVATQKNEVDSFAENFNIYQIIMQDDNKYNSAFFVTMFLDNKELQKMGFSKKNQSMFVGGTKISHEDKHAILLLQDYARIELEKMNAEYKKYYDTEKLHKLNLDAKEPFSKNDSGIISFTWPDIQEIVVNEQVGYQSEVRFAGSFAGMVTSFYVKAYAFNVKDDGVAIVAFYTADSERVFWQSIFDKSMKENVSFKNNK